MSYILTKKELSTSIEWKIYQKIKEKVLEEEIKPLKKKVTSLEEEIKVLKRNYRKMINPSIKILRKLKI
jgi:cell division protein FtsB